MGIYFKWLVCTAGMLREERPGRSSSLGNKKTKEKSNSLMGQTTLKIRQDFFS